MFWRSVSTLYKDEDFFEKLPSTSTPNILHRPNYRYQYRRSVAAFRCLFSSTESMADNFIQNSDRTQPFYIIANSKLKFTTNLQRRRQLPKFFNFLSLSVLINRSIEKF